MPRGIKAGSPAPNENMLERAREGRIVNVCPDKDTIRKYIKKRMAEGNLSVNRLAKEMGSSRVALQLQLTPGHAISYDMLGRLLWIVDGEDCPFDCSKEEGE
jgi:hypothetical protein